MKLKLKEEPQEWRKAAWLTALGLAVLNTVLCWRRALPIAGLVVVLGALAAVAVGAWRRPRWFRGYYRCSTRVGFHVSQFLGRAVLAVLFLVVLTPLGLALRLFGKDLLRLKRSPKSETYWNTAHASTPLDRLF